MYKIAARKRRGIIMGGQDKIVLHRRFLIFYKKNTLSLFLSFLLTFLLASAMLVLIHTNHRIENIEYKTIFTPSDCLIEDLSWQQVKKLKENPAIGHLALEQAVYAGGCNKNGKSFYMHKGDGAYITLMAKVLEGRLPETPDEVVAEKWVLLNLGVQPEPGQEFEFRDGEGKTRLVKVSGILSGMRGNISYGTLMVYTGIDKTEDLSYIAYITFKNAQNHDTVIEEICKELKVKQKQVRKCPAREDFNELFYIDIQIMGVILFVCLVIFYGIYKIVLVTREKQYGILYALGMGRRQMLVMVLSELYQVYFMGAFAGTMAGILAAWFIARVSGDADTVVYLYNKSVEYDIIIPVPQIITCIIVMAVFTGIAGYFTSRNIINKPLAEIISGAVQYKNNRLHFPGISSTSGKICTLFSLSCKYILRNLKLSIFVIITMCTGITLFTGLAYKLETMQLYRMATKESWYLNGQYEMSVKSFDSPYQGVSRKAASEILEMDGVKGIKTSAGISVRVVDEAGVKRNDRYYNKFNADMKKHYGYGMSGYDGTNQVYKTSLCGYNTSALKELEKYVVSGSFDAENLKEDEIILAVLSMEDINKDNIPGWYKEGTKLMEYKAGDEIIIKYRADFDTANYEYEALEDKGRYIYKTYKVAAVVSFEYMYGNRTNVYPRMVTSDQNIQKIIPGGSYHCIYIDATKDMPAAGKKELERKLVSTGAKFNEVSVRSLEENIKQNEMFFHKQMVYICGIAFTVFILVLLNMANNLEYRMYSRTREICMLRAVGMSVLMAREIFLFENLVLGIISVIAAYFMSHPVLYYLYKISDMKLYGYSFAFKYTSFMAISITALVLCILLSLDILKTWKTKYIMEAMGKAD